MKFTDGNWLVQPGYEFISPIQPTNVRVKSDSIILNGSPKDMSSRSNMVDSPLLTVKFSSPMEGVIRVQTYRHKGGVDKTPEFQINEDASHQVMIERSESEATLTSGSLSVTVNTTGTWGYRFDRGSKRITSSGHKSLSHITTPEEGTFMREQLNLAVGEYVYGLGERFTPFVKNGQVVDIWNEDGGTSSEQAYKNIPFYLSNQGYGVFVNHPELVSYELASERVSKAQFSVSGEYLEYFIIDGPQPKQVLDRYTQLTGRPALPPAWSFGLWLTTSFTTNYDEETVNHFVDGMAERDIPLHVFHFDCFWMKGFHWTDFKWDEEVFPDPQGMLTRLKEKGYRICVWINPYIGQESHLFDEGKEKGYLLIKPNGDVWQWDKWQAGMGIVDFTNPDACKWYADKLRELIDMGVDSFKTDFGERIPTDVIYHDGSDPYKMHNYYTFLFNELAFNVLKEKRGEGEAVLFARSATAGGQQFPVHWGGDCDSTYEAMAESLRGGLSLGLSGFGYWSHDIGGFESTAPADLYMRWVAFGLLSSHSRLHGSRSYRVPWLYEEQEPTDVLRFFTKLKSRLMPYLYNAAQDAPNHGTPMMRAMMLEFPEDRACDVLDQQYMLGESLLVAPIFNPEGTANFYLPQGRWTHFLSGKEVEGGTWLEEQHDYMSLPLYVRPNSIVAVGSDDTKPDYDFADGVELQIFALEDGQTASTTVYDMLAKPELNASASRQGSEIKLQVQGSGKPWSAQLRGIAKVAQVSGASLQEDALGVKLIPSTGASEITIQLT